MEDNLILDKFGIDVKTDEEILDDLLESIIEFILNTRKNSILDDLEKTYLGLNYPKFIERDFYKDPEKVKYYDLGMLNMLYTIYKTIKSEYEEETQKLEMLKHKYAYDFICFLSTNCISNSDKLCNHLKISKSTLYKFLSKIKHYDCFVVSKHGRNSFIYINRNGIKLHKSILKMKEISEIYMRIQ